MNVSTNASSDAEPRLDLCAQIYLCWNFACVLTLPVFLLVLGLAAQYCRNPDSSAASHSDVVTFNMSALEVVGVAGACVPVAAFFRSRGVLFVAGANLTYLVTVGQTQFHLLVCAERYVAVVHPVAYLRWKKNAALVRNGCIVAVWLCSFGLACLYHFKDHHFIVASVLFWGLSSLVLLMFFCVRVLCVLIRPGPGQRGRVDQNKRRAVYAMSAITAVLLLKFATLFFTNLLYATKTLRHSQYCILIVSAQWFNIPSALVLPVLLLHRLVMQRKATQKHPK